MSDITVDQALETADNLCREGASNFHSVALAAEVRRLRVELAAARADAIEECAKACDEERKALLHKESEFLPHGEPTLIKMAAVASCCAAAIRALKPQQEG